MKKRTLTSIIICCAVGVVLAQNSVAPAIPRDAKLEAKIEKTLKKMTLDEKIGQMLELNLDIMGKYDDTGKWQLNETMLDTLISKNGRWAQSSMPQALAPQVLTSGRNG